MNNQENEEQYRKLRTETDPKVVKELNDKWRMDRISHPDFVKRIVDLATEAEERGVF